MSHKLIMESWRQYTEHHELFEKHSYIREVLSIQPMLNEDGSIYYDKNLREQIIQEHLLFEGFFDDAKQLGGDAKKLFTVLRQLISDPTKIVNWIRSVVTTVIKRRVTVIYGLLNTMIEKLPSYNMPTFAKWAQGVKNMLEKFMTSLNNAQGWKGAMYVTTAALAFKWIWNQIGDYVKAAREGMVSLLRTMVFAPEEGEEDESKVAQLKDFIMEQAVDPIKEFVLEKLKNLLGEAVYTTIGGWFAWAKKSFEGAQFVLGTLRTALAQQTNVTL